ncbi:hypothetical protein [Segetibacter aerophilus]|uniref:DUF2971 domain-containing protein n=1 Tax=Segetibacter aerophilus TaxID=670293 RepID=A0A512B922_9BACT|nr:hypothetical protein [Segetibacter aerophilus]GEO08452.1 DUF2971 domain-containing protein [Segetibacter aerophilus]
MQIEKNKDYSFQDDQFLWRYMDLHRLIYFLNSENIFFSPLNSFFDPLEGITEKHLHDKEFLDALDQEKEKDEGLSKKSKEQLTEEKQEVKERFKSNLEEIQKTYFASCWYVGVRESLAMWDTYSNKDSVALKFNPDGLCNTIIESCRNLENQDFDLLVHGKVEYFKISPFDPNDSGLKNAGHRFKGFLKDLSYKHEEEFRFLAMQNNNNKTYSFFELSLKSLHDLDFSIVTHPYMEPWKHQNIYNILKTKGWECKLVKSEIPTRMQVFDTP